MSSLQCLTKLDQSTAVKPTDDDEEESQAKLIVGKYLNQLLAVLVDFSEQNQNNMNILSLLQLEKKLSSLFAFAEQKEIIPETEETQGWKKGVAQHQQLADRIMQIMGQDEEDANEE
ncbi:hypothetical protein TRFO_04248 [Tritrichomonas foetus]|uniref:Uncharacterized protein n=1 Tax=Tritrichomonas foetus TaxID=1144522 RepID=A0A1J4KK75_9EUKA|nr:hypothetical protein TRFO_04248 [Tritrichomonas foetus]|eukprot:OHT10244.1 hypothetical protein TRFO_04248 [Tritrichomonas foetus]